MFFKSKPNPVTVELPKALDALWRFAYRLTGNPEDAEELVQKTALRALEKQHLYQTEHRFLSWLFSIAHSVWKNELRSRKIREDHRFDLNYQGLSIDDMGAPDSNQAENELMLNSVLKAVNQLPEAQRTPMLLVHVEGLSYKEATMVLETPIGTLMSRLARARIKIGELMNPPSEHKGNHYEKN